MKTLNIRLSASEFKTLVWARELYPEATSWEKFFVQICDDVLEYDKAQRMKHI